jgi:hypothetical protein
MPLRDRLRQRAIVSLLKANDLPPRILATQIFFLFDEPPSLAAITDNMTPEKVVVTVGRILHSKQRILEDVEVWAKELFRATGLPFDVSTTDDMGREETAAPVPALSVVPSQPATSKTETQPKRRTRRVYLALAIQYLEQGSCTHKELVDAIMKQFPHLNRETVATFAFDIQNPKYTPIKARVVVKLPDGKLIFEDRIKPALTVIENPNHAGTNEAGTEPSTDIEKHATSSIGDV